MTKVKPSNENFKCETCDQDVEWSRASIASTLTVLRQSILHTNKMAQSKIKQGIASMEGKIFEISNTIDKWDGKMDAIRKKLNATNKYLFNLEETLLNVLLAIRQNEYLQAWYPEQNGFPPMKVTGVHPAVVDKNKRRQNVNPNQGADNADRKD